MSQPDTILRTTRNSEEEFWYSEDYLRNQIELVYQSGIAQGLRVEIHIAIMQPSSNAGIQNSAEEFWRVVNEKYIERFNAGSVWRVAGKRKIGP